MIVTIIPFTGWKINYFRCVSTKNGAIRSDGTVWSEGSDDPFVFHDEDDDGDNHHGQVKHPDAGSGNQIPVTDPDDFGKHRIFVNFVRIWKNFEVDGMPIQPNLVVQITEATLHPQIIHIQYCEGDDGDKGEPQNPQIHILEIQCGDTSHDGGGQTLEDRGNGGHSGDRFLNELHEKPLILVGVGDGEGKGRKFFRIRWTSENALLPFTLTACEKKIMALAVLIIIPQHQPIKVRCAVDGGIKSEMQRKRLLAALFGHQNGMRIGVSKGEGEGGISGVLWVQFFDTHSALNQQQSEILQSLSSVGVIDNFQSGGEGQPHSGALGMKAPVTCIALNRCGSKNSQRFVLFLESLDAHDVVYH